MIKLVVVFSYRKFASPPWRSIRSFNCYSYYRIVKWPICGTSKAADRSNHNSTEYKLHIQLPFTDLNHNCRRKKKHTWKKKTQNSDWETKKLVPQSKISNSSYTTKRTPEFMYLDLLAQQEPNLDGRFNDVSPPIWTVSSARIGSKHIIPLWSC